MNNKSSTKEDTRKMENCKADNIPEKHFLQKLLEIGEVIKKHLYKETRNKKLIYKDLYGINIYMQEASV